MPSPLDSYAPRSWEAVQISIKEGHDDLPTEKAEGFVECPGESPIAEAAAKLDDYDPDRMFFYDFEQIAAGHTPHGSGPLMRLTEEYRGHEAGKLCFVTYEGMELDPPMFMLYLEN